MNTTQALAEITDAGLFEKIATSVLRYAEPEIYGNVSHQGVNPQGKTVKAPLDNVGWHHTEVDETIVCIAHTTTSKSDLEQKWLRDLDNVKPRKKGGKPTGTDGDLVKAIKEINEIKRTHPNIKARLALAINCEESQELRTQVQTLSVDNDIVLDIWSVSRLADFLDTNPDGQIIRRNNLGIAPIRLSKQLLLEIGDKSLSNFKFDAELFIERNFKPVYQNTLVVGVSGAGKTTQCISILKKYLKLQKPVLVLSDSTVNQAVSIEEAVDIELHRYANELIPQSGLQALELCSIDEPLMILVEDINRSSDSARLLRKLIDWSNSNVNFILLCPVWHRLIAGLSFEERKGLEAHFKLEYLESYNEDEANRAVLARATQEKIQLDELSAANTAQQLGYDPLLISLANLAEFHENANVIAEYVRNTIQSIATRSDLLAYEVEDAIDEYGLHLFQNKKVQGESRDLRALSQSSQKAFKQILMDGRLFRQAFESPDDAIMSRHDRLNG
jgi:adenylate kinase family enzyme